VGRARLPRDPRRHRAPLVVRGGRARGTEPRGDLPERPSAGGDGAGGDAARRADRPLTGGRCDAGVGRGRADDGWSDATVVGRDASRGGIGGVASTPPIFIGAGGYSLFTSVRIFSGSGSSPLPDFSGKGTLPGPSAVKVGPPV